MIVQLVELRGEGAWKQMRYDLDVSCTEMRGAEKMLVEVKKKVMLLLHYPTIHYFSIDQITALSCHVEARNWLGL